MPTCTTGSISLTGVKIRGKPLRAAQFEEAKASFEKKILAPDTPYDAYSALIESRLTRLVFHVFDTAPSDHGIFQDFKIPVPLMILTASRPFSSEFYGFRFKTQQTKNAAEVLYAIELFASLLDEKPATPALKKLQELQEILAIDSLVRLLGKDAVMVVDKIFGTEAGIHLMERGVYHGVISLFSPAWQEVIINKMREAEALSTDEKLTLLRLSIRAPCYPLDILSFARALAQELYNSPGLQPSDYKLIWRLSLYGSEMTAPPSAYNYSSRAENLEMQGNALMNQRNYDEAGDAYADAVELYRAAYQTDKVLSVLGKLRAAMDADEKSKK